jgi:enoyl-CoA hydratase/carnithine racemase
MPPGAAEELAAAGDVLDDAAELLAAAEELATSPASSPSAVAWPTKLTMTV